MPTEAAVKAEEALIHVLWINAGLSCDGDSVALTAATQPSIEEIALGALPGLPKIAVHWPLIDFECGPTGGADDFLEWFFKGERGELDPFVLVVEGSIPNEALKDEGYWCGFGNDPATGQPMTTSEWLDRLATVGGRADELCRNAMLFGDPRSALTVVQPAWQRRPFPGPGCAQSTDRRPQAPQSARRQG